MSLRPPESLDPDPADLALLRGYPSAEWLEPFPVLLSDGRDVYACRICIARYGLAGRELPNLSQQAGDVIAHLRTFHHLEPLPAQNDTQPGGTI